MRRWLLAVCVGGVGCAVTPAVPDVPAVVHPADLFPAPPGFVPEVLGRDRWAFTGRGTTQQATLFYQVSCVEFFDWRLCEDAESPDGVRRLVFQRPGATLRVDVRADGSADSLRVLVTLERDASPDPAESHRGNVAAAPTGQPD